MRSSQLLIALLLGVACTTGAAQTTQPATVGPGKSADFVVLQANPLDDITNTRRIAQVVVRGHEVDRARLRAGWVTGTN